MNRFSPDDLAEYDRSPIAVSLLAGPAICFFPYHVREGK